MQKMLLKSWLMLAITVLAVSFAPSAIAQLTTSGLTGIVRDADGRAVGGANITAVFTPTNATFRAVSNTDGRFYFRGLPVGGPYLVTAAADGLQGEPIGDVTALLGTDVDVNLTLRSDIVKLDTFSVTADRDALDSNSQGAGSSLSSEQIGNRPSSERSLADMVSASPLVTLRSTFGDREESQITAVGQNNRYNSIQIDGSRINDLFGLNGTGLASFFNPLSIDTIEQLAVQISPYDVRQAGFTGASINAVTKSGTNKFKGSIYGYFRGDQMLGTNMQGYNARENTLTGAKVQPRLERRTWGATLGGPIWRDKIFFFLSYENFESTSAGRDPRFSTPNEAAILARLGAIATAAGDTINWGSPVTNATSNTSMDEKIMAKVDWQINDEHRLTLRYTTTEGEVPQFGVFASSNSNNNSVSGGPTTTPDGHFYSQTRQEKTIAGQLVSQWSSDLKTEIKYSSTTQDQLTPINTVAPFITITGVSGTDLINNNSITNGTYAVGTEQFRQGNVIGVDSQQFSATADYFWNNILLTAGYEREATDFYNLFRQGSYGLVAYRNYADFLADQNAVITRNVTDTAFRPIADISSMATNGLFVQGKWDVNSRLSVTAGVRYEFVETGAPPALNQPFLTTTGFRNDGTIDGTSSFSPRIGFNWAVDDARRTQIRGGIGHFFGRAPWVIFSNSWGQTGVGGFSQSSATGQLPTTLTAYLRDHFDPANPVGTATDNPADPSRRREVNWADDGTELPQSWRGNLAIEHRLPFLNSFVTLEVIQSKIDQALFVTNENIRQRTGADAVGKDGRLRFAGAPSSGTGANAKYAAYTDLLRVQNTSVGESTFVSVQWSRPMRNKWAFDLSYTNGTASEAQAIGQTTAGGQWNRNVVFNQNVVEKGTADFEIKNRIMLNLTRQFEFVKNWRTTASMVYEGRSGNPYSWVYSGDLNGDGRNDNDTVAVPTSATDSRFDFSGMTSAQVDSYFAFLQTSGLAEYAGGIAPRNGWTEGWVNRLDLKFAQSVPVYGSAKLDLFLDFINFGSFISKDTFGYFEIAPSLANDVFRKRFLGGAAYGTDGRIRPTYTTTPTGFNIDNGMSRWRIQLGARLTF